MPIISGTLGLPETDTAPPLNIVTAFSGRHAALASILLVTKNPTKALDHARSIDTRGCEFFGDFHYLTIVQITPETVYDGSPTPTMVYLRRLEHVEKVARWYESFHGAWDKEGHHELPDL